MTGASPAAMVAMLEGLGADAIGANCSLGPAELGGVVSEYLKYSSLPVLLKPNAGLPKSVDGKTVYDVLPEEFSNLMCEYVKSGTKNKKHITKACYRQGHYYGKLIYSRCNF